jgi:hypothetical protein
MLPRVFCLILLGLFVTALLPLPPAARHDAADLRTAIVTVRQLSQAATTVDANFAEALAQAVNAVNTLAGLTVTVSKGQEQADGEQYPLSVTTRIAYLPSQNSWAIPHIPSQLLADEHDSTYISFIVIPETPPPVHAG